MSLAKSVMGGKIARAGGGEQLLLLPLFKSVGVAVQGAAAAVAVLEEAAQRGLGMVVGW